MVANGPQDERTESFVALTAGLMVSHYKIINKIGSGGMGDVYLALDTELGRTVALKFLSAQLCRDDDCRKRFRREAQSAAKLSHPNIVTIHDVGEMFERPYLVLEYVEGRSLRDFLGKDYVTLGRLIELAVQICDGLECAHRAGVIHRDIKPSNIIIDQNGRPRIFDFGLATVRGEDHLTQPGYVVGTSSYMSPEQVSGKPLDHRSDIFSLGVVLYELLAGRHPFKRDNEAATMHAIASEAPDPITRYRGNVPDEIQRVLEKALDKDPNERYQHVDELRTDLLPFRTGSDTTLRIRRRRSRLSIAGAILALVTAVLAAIPGVRTSVARFVGGAPDNNPIHLAILPISALDGGSTGQAFCDGLRETLTSRLTQMERFHGTLWVVPASEVTERNVTSVKEARRAFGVTHAVTGSIQQAGSTIRLALNLVDTKADRQIRAEIVDVPVTQLPSLQDSTVSVIAAMLEVQLKPGEMRALAVGGTRTPEAYGAYLEGRGYLQRYEKLEYVDSAIARLREAIRLDSRYALAYAGLGEAYWYKYKITNEPGWVTQATGNSQIALALNDSLPLVHTALGRIHYGTGEYQKSADEYKRALQTASNDCDALRGLARTYEALGRGHDAETYYRRIIELHPGYWAGYFDLGLFYVYANRHDEAVQLLERAAELAPENARDYNDLGGLYCLVGLKDQARRIWERSIEMEPSHAAYSNLGYLHYTAHRYAEAAQMYEEALKLNPSDHNIWSNLASAYYWQPAMRHKTRETYRRAIVEAEKRRQVNPNDPVLIASLAEYYGMVGDTLEARRLAGKALALDPENTEVILPAVFAFESIGERDSAVVLIRRALELGYPGSELASYPGLEELIADSAVQAALEYESK